eukprot:CAMPEP_0115100520 /NCGR_PEP_ID=MMETSP0227-20121206/32625_1 /TAXON_ID=89957 /ORGANISM="Polarella glacialis, Strain CCMP 1383" /LENGTH=305 /DNA_ID=CAMNT_0002495975 /DNA_START=287 /DNA_END=1204 /DNA_ORIENTATION=-
MMMSQACPDPWPVSPSLAGFMPATGLLPPHLPSSQYSGSPVSASAEFWPASYPCSPTAASLLPAGLLQELMTAEPYRQHALSPTHAAELPQQDATRAHLIVRSPWEVGCPAATPPVVRHAPPPPPPSAPAPSPMHAWVLESKLTAESVRAQQERWAEEMRRKFVGAEATPSPAPAAAPKAQSPATPTKPAASRACGPDAEQLLLLLTGQAITTPGKTLAEAGYSASTPLKVLAIGESGRRAQNAQSAQSPKAKENRAPRKHYEQDWSPAWSPSGKAVGSSPSVGKAGGMLSDGQATSQRKIFPRW